MSHTATVTGPILILGWAAKCRGRTLRCHCLPWQPVSKARMQRLDHAMIYVKIAASIGPLAWVAHGAPVATALIALSWTIAVFGALQKLFWPRVHPRISSYVQVAQAVLILPAMLELGAKAPGEAGLPLGVAGLCYAVGGVVFLLERPVLWPRRFSFHELFHTLVVAGGLALALTLQRLPSLSLAAG